MARLPKASFHWEKKRRRDMRVKRKFKGLFGGNGFFGGGQVNKKHYPSGNFY
jgi:hypothetical protein